MTFSEKTQWPLTVGLTLALLVAVITGTSLYTEQKTQVAMNTSAIAEIRREQKSDREEIASLKERVGRGEETTTRVLEILNELKADVKTLLRGNKQ